MSSGPVRGGTNRGGPDRRGPIRWLAVEALTAGLAYGAGLCWVSVCLLGSFRPEGLGAPYWSGLPGLRTDTSGIMAFFVVAVCLAASEYLRLRRRRDAPAQPGPAQAGLALAGGPAKPLALAVSETVALLATGLAGYLSVNAVTHPWSLAIHATHLAPWPTEGTLRVAALLLCVGSVTVLRYLWAGPDTRPAVSEPANAPDRIADWR
jgi:hypothetical protein